MYLFIYGTLMENSHISLAQQLRLKSHSLGRATVTGFLYDLGDYPGLVEDHSKSHQVHGQLIEVHDISIIPHLDEYEGAPELYERKLMPCTLDDHIVDAWVYVYQQEVKDHQLIQSGDYYAQ